MSHWQWIGFAKRYVSAESDDVAVLAVRETAECRDDDVRCPFR